MLSFFVFLLLRPDDPADPYQGERDQDMSIAPPPDNPTLKGTRRRVPNAAAHRLYDSWTTLLPTLVDALVAFMSNSMGLSPPPQVGHITGQCTDGMHERKTSNIACLVSWGPFCLRWRAHSLQIVLSSM